MTVAFSTCCGLMELRGINTMRNPKDVVVHLANKESHLQRSHVVFSDPTSQSDSRMGSKLEKFIKNNHLGTLAFNTATNRNSGNKLRVWVWCPDWRVINANFKGEKPKIKRINNYY